MNVILQKNNYGPFRRSQLLLLTAASAAILAVVPLQAASAEEVDAPAYLLPDMAPVSDTELSQNSGGFSIGNLDVSFGFTITTSIHGAMITPVQIVQNFGVDSPGHVSDLGTQIHNDVNPATISGGDGGSNGKDAPAATSSDLVASSNLAPSSDPAPQNAGGGLQVGQNQVNLNLPGVPNSSTTQGTTGDAKIADGTPNNTKTTFTQQLDPQTGGFSLTNDLGTKVDVSTAHGILTTVTNTLDNVSVQTQVDLNYAINNYQGLIQNAQAFQQAMSLAQQMLAIHGLSH
jgi:hypothetical protein